MQALKLTLFTRGLSCGILYDVNALKELKNDLQHEQGHTVTIEQINSIIGDL